MDPCHPNGGWVMECQALQQVLHLMWMAHPNQADSLQGSQSGNVEVLAANDLGIGSGWQQSKQNWALSAVVGKWVRVICSDLCWRTTGVTPPALLLRCCVVGCAEVGIDIGRGNTKSIFDLTSVRRVERNLASQRSLHNAPIFRLLLKVAVKGTHQCDFTNFCCTSWVPTLRLCGDASNRTPSEVATPGDRI